MDGSGINKSNATAFARDINEASKLKRLSNTTAGIILAAGMSARMKQPKQLLSFRGKYLLEWVLDAALSSRLDAVILVLGYQHRRIINALGENLSHPRLQTIINHDFKEGLSRSLRTGLTYAKAHSSVMFLLADQPLVSSALINLLIEQFHGSGKGICVPAYQGKRGNPVLIGSGFYEDLMAVQGDVGARNMIASNPKNVLEVEVLDPDLLRDIDTLDDLEAFPAENL